MQAAGAAQLGAQAAGAAQLGAQAAGAHAGAGAAQVGAGAQQSRCLQHLVFLTLQHLVFLTLQHLGLQHLLNSFFMPLQQLSTTLQQADGAAQLGAQAAGAHAGAGAAQLGAQAAGAGAAQLGAQAAGAAQLGAQQSFMRAKLNRPASAVLLPRQQAIKAAERVIQRISEHLLVLALH